MSRSPSFTALDTELVFPSLKTVGFYLIPVVAVFLAYANVYNNQFLFDDEFLIQKNQFLRSWHTLGEIFLYPSTGGASGIDAFYRPLQILLYFLVYQFSGLSTITFHFLNVALHALNASLMCRIGRKLGFNSAAVLAASLIWALHPVHTEAVTYMSGTADVLYAFFCLLGIAVLLPRCETQKFYWAVPIFILALLSKETAVIFPLLAMSCIFFVSENRWKPSAYFKTWPLWAAAAIYLLARATILDFNGTFEFYKHPNIYTEHISFRLFTFLATLPDYLRLLFWPAGLHMERNFPVFINLFDTRVLIGLGFFLLAAGHVIFNRNPRLRPLSWGLIWFASAHLPHTGILLPVNAIFLEHWLYLPSLGLILGSVQSITLYAQKKGLYRPLLLTGAALTAVAFAVCTFQRNKIWSDPITFYMDIFKYNEQSPRAHNNLGMAYVEKGEYLKAIDQYRLAIEESDTYAQTHHNLAFALLHLPDQRAHIGEAIVEFNRAIKLNPNFFQSYDALAEIYAFLGDQEKADFYRNKADGIRKTLGP